MEVCNGMPWSACQVGNRRRLVQARQVKRAPLCQSESLARARARCSQAHLLLPGVDGLQHHQRDGDVRRNPGARARAVRFSLDLL